MSSIYLITKRSFLCQTYPLVTGSSRGIGASIAQAAAEAGAKVIVNYVGGQADAETVF